MREWNDSCGYFNTCINTAVTMQACACIAYPKWPLLKPWCVYDCAGIVKTHHLGFQECEALQAVFTKELCPNHIAGPAR